MTMITFTKADMRFIYRIVGVAIEDGRVLLHKAEDEDFWALPGGRSELLEPAKATLCREMREELGIDVEVVRLLWLVENFFQYSGLNHHELGLYFLMQTPVDWPYRMRAEPFLGDEHGVRLIFQWFLLEALPALRVYPSFLASGLSILRPARSPKRPGRQWADRSPGRCRAWRAQPRGCQSHCAAASSPIRPLRAPRHVQTSTTLEKAPGEMTRS